MGKAIRAVILAGGKGERLLPVTSLIPKPMVKISGKPILEHVVRLVGYFGIKEIVICVGYLSAAIKEYFRRGEKFGLSISYRMETKPLGTAGAMRKFKNKIKNTFIVCYGDCLRELNIRDLVKFHRRKRAVATICVYENNKPDPKSIVVFDKSKKITEFRERPNTKTAKRVWSNASFYVFEPNIFSYLAKDQGEDFGKDLIPRLIKSGEKVFAFVHKGYFLDIGTKEKIKQANKDYRLGKIPCY